MNVNIKGNLIGMPIDVSVTLDDEMVKLLIVLMSFDDLSTIRDKINIIHEKEKGLYQYGK